MGRKKDEYRRRIAFLKRLRLILLAAAAVLTVCIAVAVLKGQAPKPPVIDDPQSTSATTQSQIAPETSAASVPTEPRDQEDNNAPDPGENENIPTPDDNNVFGSSETPSEPTDSEGPVETVTETTGPVPGDDPNRNKNEALTPNSDGILQHQPKITAETSAQTSQQPRKKEISLTVKLLILLLGLDLAAVAAVSACIHKLEQEYKKLRKPPKPIVTDNAGSPIGTLHNIGARPYQEDSLGTTALSDGVLAVVADGMGGLSGGDKVSQLIVRSMLQQASALQPGQFDGVLEQLLARVNAEVNQMLGADGIYKSGSTFLAVLLRNERFHWITVGDSRIYLYHNGRLTQLNQEHNRGQELLDRAVAGEMSFTEARGPGKKSNVTSFLGMGKLKYVDKSIRSIPLAPGDRVLLMSDGVFNTLTDEGIAAVLASHPDAQAAADELERLIVQAGIKKQDNFSAVILSI